MNAGAGQVDGRRDGEASPLDELFSLRPERILAGLRDRYPSLEDVLAGRRSAVIVPAARLGRRVAAALIAGGARVAAFGDKDTALHGSTVDGIPVLSLHDIAAAGSRHVALIATTMYDSEISEALDAARFGAVIPFGYLNLRLPAVFNAREYDGAWSAVAAPENRAAIEATYKRLADGESRRVFMGKLWFYRTLEKKYLDQIRGQDVIYFDKSVYQVGPSEIVADGGAFKGDTLDAFRRASAGQFREYHAFEPDDASFATLSEAAAQDPERITVIRAGLGRVSASARLLSTRGVDSRILRDDEPGGMSISIVSLDDYFRDGPKPTLIKMDIEGAEQDALEGAAGVIEGTSPVLAISAYHFPTDLWNLPMLISRLLPQSRLFLRHYTREVDDTVCYALPPGR